MTESPVHAQGQKDFWMDGNAIKGTGREGIIIREGGKE
jgi:hypothetical protein